MFRRLRAWLLPAIIVTCPALAAAGGTPPLPETLYAVVEIRDLSSLAREVGTFASGFAPSVAGMPLQASMMRPLKTTDLTAVDWSAPIRLVFLGPLRAARPTFVFKVQDAIRYLNSLPPGAQKTGEEGDVRLYSRPTSPVMGESAEQETFAVGIVGKQVVLAPTVEAAKAVMDVISEGGLPEGAVLPGGGVSAVLEVARLLEEVTETRGNPFDKLRNQLLNMPQPAAGLGSPEGLKEVLDAEISAFEVIATQIERLLVTVSFTGDKMRIGLRMEATEGGGLARYIASVPAGEPATLGYLPDDAWLVVAAKIGDFKPAVEWWTAVVDKLGASGGQPGLLGTMAQTAKEAFSLYGNEVGFAMTSKPGEPMAVTELIEVTDAQRVADVSERMNESMSKMMQSLPAVGMQIKTAFDPSAATYKGKDISQWKFSFDFEAPPGVQDEQFQQALAAQRKVFKQLYGAEMLTYSTVIDNYWTITVGPDSLDRLKAAIDGRVQSIADTDAFQSALALMPEKRTGVCYLSLGGFANWYLGIIKAALESVNSPLAGMAKSLNIKFDSGPGVVTTSNWSGTTVDYHCAVPAAELSVLVQGYQRAMMQMMQQQQGVAPTLP